jgi:antitoxin component YwqK of YwqJK toxin-antitoxin module
MKRILKICILFAISFQTAWAQDVVPNVIPRPKTKAERKAENKKKTLEQRVEDVLPVDIGTPKPAINLPGNNKISSVEDAKKFMNETLPSMANSVKAKSKKARKAIEKAKLDVFDGRNYEKIAIQKKTYKKGSGPRMIYQEFYVLKANKKPSYYSRTLFWYDLKTKKVVEALVRDTQTNILMHGPFKEYRGEGLVKEGYYYLGTKHGLWVEYDKDFNLVDKEYYNKGFYQESIISYYGSDSVKIKEVLPKLYGKTTGNYLKYYEDGTLEEEGRYDDSKKIGKWVEYYNGGNRRKKETQHPGSFFDTAEPFVLREYDAAGKLTYEHETIK